MSSLGTLIATQRIETGKRYISDLTDVDAGVGGYLLSLIDNMQSFGNAKQHDPFLKFTQRAKGKKLFHSTEIDPKRFLTQVRQKCFDKNGANNNKNENALPVIYFHRAPSYTMDAETKEVVIKNCCTVEDDNGEILAEVDAVPLILRYHVYILAWDEISLTKLSTGLFTSMATSSREIFYNTQILNAVKESATHISSPLLNEWSDMSADNTADRLLVLETNFEVQAHVYQARAVTTKKITYDIQAPFPFYTLSDLGS